MIIEKNLEENLAKLVLIASHPTREAPARALI